MASQATPAPHTRALAAAIPVATAIGIFGIVYGAAAGPLLGPAVTVLSSLIMFSGAAQFTMVALVAAGGGPAAIVGAVAALALRHLPLGVILQPRLTASRPRRAAVSLFLTDETTGLALTTDDRPERTIAICGGLAYAAWVAGTVIGLGGGTLASAEPLAAALFPVLFVGLAALMARTRMAAARAMVAGAAALALLLVWPAAGTIGAIAVAAVVTALVRAP